MLSGKDSQVAAFLERVPPPTDVDDGVSPRVLFPGDLLLNREQEEAMVGWFLGRKLELEDELGRQEVLDSDTIAVPENGDIDGMKFLPKMALFEALFSQKVDWRRTQLGGIYLEGQNLHMPMFRRICNQMISRALNYFFGSDPWFAMSPVGDMDQQTAQSLDQFCKFKLEGGKVKQDLKAGVRKTFICGQQVMKTRHWTDSLFYETTETIAVDPTGEPLLAHDGDYITAEDKWVPQQPPAGPVEGAPVIPDAAGSGPEAPDAEPPANAMGGDAMAPAPLVLQRNPATSYPPEGLVWKTMRVRRRLVRYSGPEAKCVDRKDFLCSQSEPDIQLASCVAHLYDVQALDIVSLYLLRLQREGNFNPDEWPRVVNLLYRVSSESRDPKAGAKRPSPELGETDASASDRKAPDPVFECAEFYGLYDANQDGQLESIHLLLDVKSKTPISYDHLPNVFRDGARPFHNLRINPVEGRWTGEGIGEILYQLQRFIDLVVNRWDMSISQSGTVTFWAPEQTIEGQANKDLKLHGGETYRKRDAKMKAEDIVERVYLTEFKGGTLQEILEFGLQMMTNLMGVGNVNDAEMAGLDTADLATGVRNMEKSGQEQFAPYISDLEPGITSVADACCKLAVWHMDPVESFSINEDNSLSHLVVEADAMRALKFDVTMELTRYRPQQAAAESSAAVGTILEFYGQPAPLQILLLPLYQKRLKCYGVQNPNRYLVPGQFQMAPMPAPGAAPAAQDAATANSEPGSPSLI